MAPRLAVPLVLLLLSVGHPTAAAVEPSVAAARSPAGLTWAPPAGYQDYTPYWIPRTGGTLRLADQTDYLLRAPSRVTGPVRIQGGRHVVWIGGRIDIDACCNGGATNRRAVVIMDGTSPAPGRIVHLEGLRIGGDHLAEGIDINADVAIVQLENIRVDDLRLRSGGHPDVIQPWGSYRELRVDRLTARTDYQGLFLRVDRANHPLGGPVYLRRVNLRAVQSAQSVGHTLLSMWDSTGPVHVDEVYSHPHPNSRYGPGAGRATVVVRQGRRIQPVTEAGRMAWPDHPLWVRTWDGHPLGSIRVGSPANGDFVPASTVGLGYVSPGYGWTAARRSGGRPRLGVRGAGGVMPR